MAFKATLIMDQQKTSAAEVEAYSGKKYELLECEYEFYQSLDESSKPSSRPQSGLIKFVMPAQGDDDLFFYNWMFNRAETHNGTIEMLLSLQESVVENRAISYAVGDTICGSDRFKAYVEKAKESLSDGRN